MRNKKPKMKFSVEKALASGGRIGLISQADRHGNRAMETPLCTLFTKGGSAPHLSADMLKKIKNLPEVACVHLRNLVNHHDSIAAYGKGLAEFTALKNNITYTTVHDASQALTTGKNDKLGVAVWGKGGKVMVDPKLYLKVQEAFRPDWFQALGDGDTDKESTKKRLGKAVDRTLDFLDEIVANMNKSEILKSSALIGVIEGGFDNEERKRSAVETATRPVQGFLIEGFEKGNSGKDLFSDDDFSKILSKTTSFLPEDKPRFTESVFSPLQVIKAFQCGIDVFSSAYPYTLTEKGHALVADYRLPPVSPMEKLETEGSPGDGGDREESFCLDLNNKKYFEDFGPILKDCSCYACANFTRSYIHHLLNTSELLAYVLLMIHNFHQYFDFFHLLRQALHDDKLVDLEDSLVKQAMGSVSGNSES